MDERNPNDYNDYSVKEILTEFVLPELRGINKRVSSLETFKNRVSGVLKVTAVGLVASAPFLAPMLAHALN